MRIVSFQHRFKFLVRHFNSNTHRVYVARYNTGSSTLWFLGTHSHTQSLTSSHVSRQTTPSSKYVFFFTLPKMKINRWLVLRNNLDFIELNLWSELRPLSLSFSSTQSACWYIIFIKLFATHFTSPNAKHPYIVNSVLCSSLLRSIHLAHTFGQEFVVAATSAVYLLLLVIW